MELGERVTDRFKTVDRKPWLLTSWVFFFGMKLATNCSPLSYSGATVIPCCSPQKAEGATRLGSDN